MNDIFERIVAAQEKFKLESINPPNVIYMNMADYRTLCGWAEQQSMVVSNDTGGVYGEVVTPINQKPTEILGMYIVKKAGAKLECKFEETQPPKEYMTMEAVRNAADSMRSVGVKLPKCGHGLIRAYCPLCETELVKQFNQDILKPALETLGLTIDDLYTIRKIAK